MGRSAAARGPQPPSCRSLLALQNQLASGTWAERHIRALAEDQTNMKAMMALLECARDAHQFMEARPGKQRQAQMRCAREAAPVNSLARRGIPQFV